MKSITTSNNKLLSENASFKSCGSLLTELESKLNRIDNDIDYLSLGPKPTPESGVNGQDQLTSPTIIEIYNQINRLLNIASNIENNIARLRFG